MGRKGAGRMSRTRRGAGTDGAAKAPQTGPWISGTALLVVLHRVRGTGHNEFEIPSYP
jgi:hypothetical protein